MPTLYLPPFQRFALAMTIILVSAMPACRKPGPYVILQGKLLRNGEPLKVSPAEQGIGWVRIDLVPDGHDMGSESTRANPDGSFEFRGLGRGVSAGKYTLEVYHYEHGPQEDALHGTFGEGTRTLAITVPALEGGATHDLGVIDLAKAKPAATLSVGEEPELPKATRDSSPPK